MVKFSHFICLWLESYHITTTVESKVWKFIENPIASNYQLTFRWELWRQDYFTCTIIINCIKRLIVQLYRVNTSIIYSNQIKWASWFQIRYKMTSCVRLWYLTWSLLDFSCPLPLIMMFRIFMQTGSVYRNRDIIWMEDAKTLTDSDQLSSSFPPYRMICQAFITPLTPCDSVLVCCHRLVVCFRNVTFDFEWDKHRYEK